MTNPWARPDNDPPSGAVGGPVFDIPLSGEPLGEGTFADADPSADPPGRIRRVVGLSALAGVALGIVAAIVIAATSGGNDETASETTLAVADDPSLLTTPPTLPPTVTVTETVTETTIVAAPAVTPAPTTEPRPPIAPGFAPVTDAGETDGGFDLLVAAAALDGVVLHSIIAVHGSSQVGTFTISVTDNLGDGRDHLLADYDAELMGVDQVEIVIDPASNLAYQRGLPGIPEGQWELFTAEELMAGTGATALGDVVHRLAEPIVSPATLALASSIDDLGLVRLDRRARGAVGDTARHYRITFDPADIAGRSIISQFVESSSSPLATIEVDAYVTADNRLALTTYAGGTGFDGAVIYLFVEALAEPVPFELPAPEQIVDQVVDGFPADG